MCNGWHLSQGLLLIGLDGAEGEVVIEAGIIFKISWGGGSKCSQSWELLFQNPPSSCSVIRFTSPTMLLGKTHTRRHRNLLWGHWPSFRYISNRETVYKGKHFTVMWNKNQERYCHFGVLLQSLGIDWKTVCAYLGVWYDGKQAEVEDKRPFPLSGFKLLHGKNYTIN